MACGYQSQNYQIARLHWWLFPHPYLFTLQSNLTYFVDAVHKYGLPEKKTWISGDILWLKNIIVILLLLQGHQLIIQESRGCLPLCKCSILWHIPPARRWRSPWCFEWSWCFACTWFLLDHALKVFAESWNNHPLSTEHNKTPNQLFVEGALQQQTLFTPSQGQSRAVMLPVSRDHVTVPRSTFSPCSHLTGYLDQIDTLRDSDTFGIDIYKEAVEIVGLHLTLSCQDCNQNWWIIHS